MFLLNVFGGLLVGNGLANLFLLSSGNTHTLFGHTGSIIEVVVGLSMIMYRFYQILGDR